MQYGLIGMSRHEAQRLVSRPNAQVSDVSAVQKSDVTDKVLCTRCAGGLIDGNSPMDDPSLLAHTYYQYPSQAFLFEVNAKIEIAPHNYSFPRSQ